MKGPLDISHESERTYYWGKNRKYWVAIAKPRTLWVGKTTHRVVDADGSVHIVPAVGVYGCYVIYSVKEGEEPVKF